MELQFDKSVCQFLRSVINQPQTLEQTQEVRLPEDMPDIGRVLGCFGQILIRGKEWRGNSMTASGGVKTWILYLPEDGNQVKTVECWVPFQGKWDFPQTKRDGIIQIRPYLNSADARSTSSRKLIVRVNVTLAANAMEPTETDIYSSEESFEGVELLRRNYPLNIPREAGETIVQLDETVSDPRIQNLGGRILTYAFWPEITEYKVLAGRFVFRGKGILHLLTEGASGNPEAIDLDVNFSQYTDLDQNYSTNADAVTSLILTNVDLDPDADGGWKLQCGMAVQYMICDRCMISIVEDAYSPGRELSAKKEQLQIPVCLDRIYHEFGAAQSLENDRVKILDARWNPDDPILRQTGDHMDVEVPGWFQVLYQDENNQIQLANWKASDTVGFATDAGNDLQINLRGSQSPEIVNSGAGTVLRADGVLTADVFAEQKLEMVTGMELGAAAKPDPQRPSLILRRVADEDLWKIAKEHGSTVDAIRDANRLEGEPERGRILLIPVP